MFSAASLWEIAIKPSLGREDFRADARLLRRGLLDNGYDELAVGGDHAVAITNLPPIHKDPFDRMLVAQSSRNTPAPCAKCETPADAALMLASFRGAPFMFLRSKENACMGVETTGHHHRIP